MEIFLSELLSKWRDTVNINQKVSPAALAEGDLYDLMYLAHRIREKYYGNKVSFCSIINARSGQCGEDCRFCAQSGHYPSAAKKVPRYGLKGPEQILQAAREAEGTGAARFSIVTSGRAVESEKDWEKIYRTVILLKKELSLAVDASLGFLDKEHAGNLKEAGLDRYHHNLETTPAFFPRICTTHKFSDRLATVELVKETGLELCCGVLLGIGESWADRFQLALLLKKINPNSIPLNFLYPVPGTPLGKQKRLSPLETLRIIALFRIVLPDKDIRICGGREYNLRQLQSWMFYAGASGVMTGNYLTTKGQSPQQDLELVRDLGLCRKPY